LFYILSTKFHKMFNYDAENISETKVVFLDSGFD
jgi:hypothetical protein